MTTERDYVLGTHDEELARLGLQHRVWRPAALACWYRAGIGVGSRVMDVGAGPGYATIDLAEIVGATGEVVAIERSARFLQAADANCRRLGLTNVRLHELDLMSDALPATNVDAVWCRWVACFVRSPSLLVEKIAAALRPGGVAVFHEYVAYQTWRFAPPRPGMRDFVHEVMASWRAAGGEPDVAPELIAALRHHGLTVSHALPIISALRPRDYAWQWPASFVETGIQRLVDLGRVDDAWAERVREDLRAAESDPESVMLTPMVLEIIATKG
jgi:SAM-dependent methyltransferase